MLLFTCKVLAVVLCSSWGLTEVMVVHLVVKLVVMVFMAVTVVAAVVIKNGDYILPSRLVADPVERVKGCIPAVSTQTEIDKVKIFGS